MSDGVLTVACVYRSGGDYDRNYRRYVRNLREGFRRHLRTPHRFVCMTDLPPPYEGLEGAEVVPLLYNWPGWWSLVELFRLTGPVLFTGLDTVLVGDISPLGELALAAGPRDFYMVRDFYHPHTFNSSVTIWNGDYSWVVDRFDFHAHTRRYRGDQDYLCGLFAEEKRVIQPVNPFFPGVVSYKVNCREGLPPRARFVCFHGRPRPHEVPEGTPWMEEHWP